MFTFIFTLSSNNHDVKNYHCFLCTTTRCYTDMSDIDLTILNKHTIVYSYFLSKWTSRYISHIGLCIDVILLWEIHYRKEKQIVDSICIIGNLEIFIWSHQVILSVSVSRLYWKLSVSVTSNILWHFW